MHWVPSWNIRLNCAQLQLFQRRPAQAPKGLLPGVSWMVCLNDVGQVLKTPFVCIPLYVQTACTFLPIREYSEQIEGLTNIIGSPSCCSEGFFLWDVPRRHPYTWPNVLHLWFWLPMRCITHLFVTLHLNLDWACSCSWGGGCPQTEASAPLRCGCACRWCKGVVQCKGWTKLGPQQSPCLVMQRYRGTLRELIAYDDQGVERGDEWSGVPHDAQGGVSCIMFKLGSTSAKPLHGPRTLRVDVFGYSEKQAWQRVPPFCTLTLLWLIQPN